jgi:hypothetical protein
MAPLFSIQRAHSPFARITALSHFSHIFYELEEHIGRDLRPFLHTKYFQILDILSPSSNQIKGFQWGSSPDTEMAIAKTLILICAWGLLQPALW